MATSAPPLTAQAPRDRVIRVFISSTFRDMHAEREELVKQVFPELRRLCDSRGVVWNEVDLRWGVTEEQKAEGKVLPVCLAEIRKCRPYFIGLLGERYGWVPEAIDPELAAAEPWLKDHLHKSVTELEIIHGVLQQPEMAEHSFFYFRDPGYAAKLPAAQRADFVEDNPERRAKLARLKGDIRQAHHQGKLAFAPHENFPDAKALAELVRQDLTQVIDRLFPAGSEPDSLDRDAAEHESLVRSRMRVYVPREEYFRKLDDHASGDGPPLVVLGESGAGKSALLANWVARLRGQAKQGSPLVIQHHIGATPASTDWATMVRRILGEFNRRFGLKLEIPDKPDALRAAFANGLYRAAVYGRVVLVLDGLNQLEDRDQALDLAWLPPELPPNVRLVVATLPGRSLDELQRRAWPTMVVELLSVDERRKLIPLYLEQYGKSLAAEPTELIANAEQTRNPLFLRVLLEELRVWGQHETLAQRIAHYLQAGTVSELFEKVFIRWENDYEGDTDLVGDLLSLLTCARRGLSESELMDLLGQGEDPIPRAMLSTLLFAASDTLVDRSGLLGLSHDFARQAVYEVYLPNDEARRAVHRRIADTFAGQPLGKRKLDELPWQLSRAQEWQRLAGLLAEPAFFKAAWKTNAFEVKAYWVEIEAASPLRMVSVYERVIHGDEEDMAWLVSALLQNTGHLDDALTIRQRLTEHFRVSGDMNSVSANLGNQALILSDRGRLDEAMALHKEEERICRQLGDLDGLQASLGNQANILYARGQLDEAMALYKEKERICRQLGNLDGLSASLGNQANIFKDRGQLDEAITLHKEEERICRQVGDLDGLQDSLCNQAGILHTRGQVEEAMALYKEGERICRQLGNLDGLQNILGGQALILKDRDQVDEAMALHKEQERICRQVGDLDGLQVSLCNQAGILHTRGQVEEAMALYKEQERICRQLGNPGGVAYSFWGQSVVLQRRGDLRQALTVAEESLRIFETHGLIALARQIRPVVARLRSRASNHPQ